MTQRISVILMLGLLTASCAMAEDALKSGLPVAFVRPERPFMLVSPGELAVAKEKIKTQAWAAESLKTLLDQADEVVADPQYFPESEGGWSHNYVSPKTAGKLTFDRKSPRRHLDPSTGEYLTGKKYDDSWNATAMHVTARQQEILAAAWTLTGNKRYAETMRKVFLDIAERYPTYRLHDKSMKLKPDNEPLGTYADTGGIAFCQSLGECNAFSRLAFSYDTLAGSGFLSPEEQELIEAKVWKPLQVYMKRLMVLHPSGGNWWVWHSTGAVVIGVLMGDQELVDAGLNAPKCGLIPHLRSGYINEDGFTAELSPSYHAYPFEALLRLAIATRRVGIDFYKEDRFRKAFDLPLAIRQPNLYMPRLNDGWHTTLVGSVFAMLYETAAGWYDDPEYMKTLTSIYASKEPVVERDSIAALLYGPVELPEEGLEVPKESRFLKASGLAVLRTPGKDWNAVLKDDIGVSGHRHPDALNLVLFANGEEVFPGTGSPSYGHPSYKAWFSQTIGHNTVTLNQNSQRIYPWGKELEFGVAGGGLSVVQSHASSRALQADPHLLMNTVPIQLRRTLVMLPSCIVDVTRSATDYKGDSPRGDFPETIVDMALHLKGELNMDSTWVPFNESLISEDRIRSNNRVPKQGYDLIEDVRLANNPSQIHGRLSQAKGGGVDIWLAPAPEGGQVYTATGLGLPGSLEQRMPMILQRRKGDVTQFAAVYAPWKDAPQVKQVTFPATAGNGVVAKIEHADGTDIVLSLPESGELSAGGITLNGILAARCEMKDGHKILLIGKSLQTGDLSLELEASGAILFESEGGLKRISNLNGMSMKGRMKASVQGKWVDIELGPSEKFEVSKAGSSVLSE